MDMIVRKDHMVLKKMEDVFSRIKRAKRIQHEFTTRICFDEDGSNLENLSKWNIVTLRNLSSTGIMFNYDRFIPIDTVIEFIMTLPFSKDIYSLGKVCRVLEPSTNKELKEISIYGIGVQFIELDTRIRKSIDAYSKMYGFEN